MNPIYVAKISLFFSALLVASNSHSANVYLKENPSTWRLQNYVPLGPVIWFSGSSCTNGQLVLKTDATDDDKNRLWSIVTSAKISNSEIFVMYDPDITPGACFITSFGMDPVPGS